MIKLHSPWCKFLKGLGEERNLQSTSVNKTNFIVCEKGFENLRLHLFFYPNNLQLQWNLWGFKWAGLKIKTNSHSGFNNSWLVPLGFSNIQNKRFSSKQRFNSKQFQILHMQNFTSGQELIFSMNFVIACCLCIGPTLVCAAMSCIEKQELHNHLSLNYIVPLHLDYSHLCGLGQIVQIIKSLHSQKYEK